VKDPEWRRRIMTRGGKMDVSAIAGMTLEEMKAKFVTRKPSEPVRKKAKKDPIKKKKQ
jgi:hypothetical protein